MLFALGSVFAHEIGCGAADPSDGKRDHGQLEAKLVGAGQPRVDEDAAFGADASRSLESAKHYLWHGNVDMALEGLEQLIFDLDLRRQHSPASARLSRSVIEFDTYIRNNRDFIPNYGERYRQGDTIMTSFVESPINQIVSKLFEKKQQMQWTPKGAHLFLQTQTKVLNDELDDVFRQWYPKFRPETATPPTLCDALLGELQEHTQ